MNAGAVFLMSRVRFWPKSYATYVLWISAALLVKFEDRHECRLWYLYVSDLAHTFLTFFLFLEEFAFTGDVTTVTLGCNVLADSLDCLTGDDLRSDGCLDRDVKLLARDKLFQFLTHSAAEVVGSVSVYQ